MRVTVRNSLIKPLAMSTVGFSCGSAGKESTCNAGDLGSIPGLGRSPEEGKGYPLQYSGLQNSMDYIVHGVAKSRTQLSDFHFHFYVNSIDIMKDVFVTLHSFLSLSLSLAATGKVYFYLYGHLETQSESYFPSQWF